ncbi:branched-chain amino acid ABC transporter permease [Kribbella jejuensis]|uniref:Amino acid/amide ABC transporter membrane protein 2 (HAAT family) n=1 Tax=Kribbella jejuensis TaxID=236068 RepID=A0A542D9Q3_9ACTN|nr:branched-chain amino acid ABC transporter permease [Kribbella jejuensis]TQI99801.1 amino acid/amide ABC transporter membrane protein 2 (HAAT family) [Kribbella jejuensis]
MTDVKTPADNTVGTPVAKPGKPIAWPLGIAGVALLVIGSFLSWSYDGQILNDLSINFYPGGLQILAIVGAVLSLVLLLAEKGPLTKLGAWLDATVGLRMLGTGLALYMVLIVIAIGTESAGFINVNPGGYVSLVGALLIAVSAWMLPLRQLRDMSEARLPGWAEILIIAVLMGSILYAAAYALGLQDAWSFILCLVFIAVVATALFRTGAMSYVGHVGQRHRNVLTLAAFVVAFLFPFTQNGSDANMSIANQVLIFGATAMGLNIVVGLAGLLDLGYIAFLGAGSYTAAVLSTSAFATIGWKPNFLIVVLIGACVSAILGLIIGTPTLRVSGDYLAIVTLGFGEIFRFTMGNLDGNNGPNLTNGPNGVPGIPDWKPFGFDFGSQHTVAGIELGRFSNYYFVLLVLIGFVILVFARLNNSRIGRGWVAIREDEKAAEAMGVNVFGLKLLAFAIGAFLAGLAGTIKAHQDAAVSPDQYQFIESAFLLAAIVLGGMGTIAGVLLGATILKLLPEKLRFFSEYRLLMFGLLLVLMMRFRPEGLVASRRRQLEFHEEDEALAVEVESERLAVEEAR